MEAWRSSARIRGAIGVPILRNFCLILQRRVGGRWAAITRTHGVDVKCTLVGITQGAHSRQTLTLVLFDDLVPGPYRVRRPRRRKPAILCLALTGSRRPRRRKPAIRARP